MADLRARLLEAAQRGLPLEPRPFAALAQELGVTEEDVLAVLRDLQDEGIIRELSVFLDPAALGYHSTLACLKAPPDRLEEVARVLAAMPEVTHNYLRDHEYNVWFTVIAPTAEAVARILEQVAATTGCGPVHDLPAEKVFKIRVAFRVDEMSP